MVALLRAQTLLALLLSRSSVALAQDFFNSRGIPYPDYRYVLFASLDEATQDDATLVLGYTEDSWNVPGTAEIELLSYSSIEEDPTNFTTSSGDNKTQLQALVDIGFDNATVYDCYVNHYGDYFWTELQDTEPIVLAAFEALGWNETSWNGASPAPPSESSDWVDLTADERDAAQEICFLAETWSQLSIEFWGIDYTNLQGNATGGGINEDGSVANDEMVDNLATLSKPVNRFYAWDSLSPTVKEVVISLGYTAEAWALVLEAPIELIRYSDLNEMQKEGVDSLGFGPMEVYDCWIHHYESYSWDELGEAGVRPYWTILGWTAASWQGLTEPPESTNDVLFVDLVPEQKQAVQQLCFTPESWDGLPFGSVPGDGVSVTLAPSADGTGSAAISFLYFYNWAMASMLLGLLVYV